MPVTPELPKQNTDIIGQKTYPITKGDSPSSCVKCYSR